MSILSAMFHSQDSRFNFSKSLLGAPTHAHKNQMMELGKQKKKETNSIIYLYGINYTVYLRLYVMLTVFFSQV